MESKRQHPRLYISLPMELQAQLPDSPEAWEGRAVLKNISQGGLYFECETIPHLKRGNVAEITFTTQPPKFSVFNSPIKTQVVVKRIDAGVGGSANFGVAVQFLKDPPTD